MDPIHTLRGEIKSFFPESSELLLSSYFDSHPRYNYYFSLQANCPFLLYLNIDGDINRYVLKCLEFNNSETLDSLIQAYTDSGSKVFNSGKPKSTVSFIYHDENRLSVQHVTGRISERIHVSEVNIRELMAGIAPQYD